MQFLLLWGCIGKPEKAGVTQAFLPVLKLIGPEAGKPGQKSECAVEEGRREMLTRNPLFWKGDPKAWWSSDLNSPTPCVTNFCSKALKSIPSPRYGEVEIMVWSFPSFQALLSIPLCPLTCTHPWTRSDASLWLAVVFLMFGMWRWWLCEVAWQYISARALTSPLVEGTEKKTKWGGKGKRKHFLRLKERNFFVRRCLQVGRTASELQHLLHLLDRWTDGVSLEFSEYQILGGEVALMKRIFDDICELIALHLLTNALIFRRSYKTSKHLVCRSWVFWGDFFLCFKSSFAASLAFVLQHLD